MRQNFQLEISKLINFINFNDELHLEVPTTSSHYAYSTSREKKFFIYKSILISLYGIIELYTEEIIKQYLDSIENEIFSYANLDQSLIDKHFNLSISLSNKIIEDKHEKYKVIDGKEVIKKLNHCISNLPKYKFNKEAFFINTGNLTHGKICQHIANVGIKLHDQLLSKLALPNSENAFNLIDDIVERRNCIAHGQVIEYLDSSEILPLIEFTEKYFQAIFEIFEQSIEVISNLFKFKCYNIPLEFYKMHSSTIVEINDGVKYNITPQSTIFIEMNDSTIITCNPISVINHESSRSETTFKFDRNVRDGFKFYLLDEIRYKADKINHIK